MQRHMRTFSSLPVSPQPRLRPFILKPRQPERKHSDPFEILSRVLFFPLF